MVKVLRCRDVGIWDCDFVVRADTEEELLKKAAEHAKTAHSLEKITGEAVEKIRAALRDE
ncbi:MAG: DUF1059 domain-containing protein [Candidatus Bipolaricaulia bacterium]